MNEQQAPRRAARGISPLAVLGIVLLVVGMAGAGYLAWELFGTTYLAQREAAQQVQDIRRSWESQGPSQVPDGAPLVTTPAPGEAAWLLRIPRLGGEWPIVAGVEPDQLRRGVGWYPTTALPGEIGNFALAGHRITRGEPFRRLLDLDVGDEVIVETAGAIFTYEINSAPRDLTVQDTDSWVLLPVPGQEGVQPTQPIVTLTTCQDFFRSPDRSVGFGVLTHTEIKQ
ncbi:MAG TPA: class E sortase [Arachnia sp.]|nr:class E sortase [Arachnia sp.]HMT87373.1 class E sortase [Arachnia sp.]